METLIRTRRKTTMTAIIVLGMALALLVSPGAFAGSSSCEKYHKYMESYHNHMRKAAEKADDRDWKDYREEIEKAQRDLAKAESYRYLCTAPGGCEYRETRRPVEYRVIPSDGHPDGFRPPTHDDRPKGSCFSGGHDDGRWQQGPRRDEGLLSFLPDIRFRYDDGHFDISLGGGGRDGRR